MAKKTPLGAIKNIVSAGKKVVEAAKKALPELTTEQKYLRCLGYELLSKANLKKRCLNAGLTEDQFEAADRSLCAASAVDSHDDTREKA